MNRHRAFGTATALLLASMARLPAEPASYSGLKADEFLKAWLVIGPIPVAADGSPDEAAREQAFAADQLASAGGEAGARPAAGDHIKVAGRDHEWRRIESKAEVIDLIELAAGKEPAAHSIAYAYAEIAMLEATRGLLGIGSDDGVKVWLNGKLIHEHWVGRGARPDDDLVGAEFVKGTNRLLLKVQNLEGPWGFACRLLGPESQAKKLLAAAREGDLDAAKLLLDRGVEVSRRAPSGLTAVQAARLRGQREMVEFLAGKGANAREPLPPPEKLADGLLSSLVKADASGAAVLVAKGGKVLFEKGYGLADRERKVPVTADTKFRIGSVTKQFTAAAILKLAEEGKLKVEDKLSQYIPDYPRGAEVTIHHLLTHTSGIHSYTSKPDFLDTVTAGVKTEEHIRSFKDDPYDFNPGEKWSYNNSGYFLLGYLVEKVSGQTYGEYLRQTFFAPLGMKDSGVHRAGADLANEATGYSFEAGEFKKALDWDMSRAGAAGAIYSTVRDLHRWNEALFAGKVLKEASLKAAFTPVKTAGEDGSQPKEAGYGYGWSIQDLRGLKEIGHGGGLQGFVSYLLRLPREDFTVAVLANCAPPPPGVDPGGLAHELAEIYLGDQLAPREIPKVDATVAGKALDAIAGRYDYGGAILTVTRDGDKVFAQLTGQPKFQIFPKSETEFFWKVVEAEVKFVKDAKGVVSKAVHRQGGQTIDAPRLDDVKVVKVDAKLLDAYAGKYSYGAAVMAVTREGDHLFAQLTGQPKFEIFPKSETEFFWKVVNARVTFVKDEKGKVTKAVHEQGGNKFDAPRVE